MLSLESHGRKSSTHMTTERDPAKLSIGELEALLHQKRHQLTEGKVMRLAAAEDALRRGADAGAEPNQSTIKPGRSPES